MMKPVVSLDCAICQDTYLVAIQGTTMKCRKKKKKPAVILPRLHPTSKDKEAKGQENTRGRPVFCSPMNEGSADQL